MLLSCPASKRRQDFILNTWVKVQNLKNPELLKFKLLKLAGWLQKWII